MESEKEWKRRTNKRKKNFVVWSIWDSSIFNILLLPFGFFFSVRLLLLFVVKFVFCLFIAISEEIPEHTWVISAFLFFLSVLPIFDSFSFYLKLFEGCVNMQSCLQGFFFVTLFHHFSFRFGLLKNCLWPFYCCVGLNKYSFDDRIETTSTFLCSSKTFTVLFR